MYDTDLTDGGAHLEQFLPLSCLSHGFINGVMYEDTYISIKVKLTRICNIIVLIYDHGKFTRFIWLKIKQIFVRKGLSISR